MAKPKDIKYTSAAKNWIKNFIVEAINNRASDIHIEPKKDKLTIRMRIDGIMYIVKQLDIKLHKQITSSIKVASGLDTSNIPMPQDGNMEFSHEGSAYNVRISSFPTIYGDAIVLRLLDRGDSFRDLSELGFDKINLERVKDLISRPYGILLITGPSGSGKTVLLYSILSYLNKTTNNIITIEDPIELRLEDVRQAQVGQYRRFNFATALRSVLRQNPDIVMVGEIRDKETAEIAIQTALTGHLVFSTFHTLDVFAIVTRFIEMGIPQSVIAHTITGVISSRLVRNICQNCKIPYQLNAFESKFLNINTRQKFYKGKGCSLCLDSGYYGRTGLFEVISFDNDIKSAILENKPFSEIKNIIDSKGFKNLNEIALDKVMQGITTVEEVIRVTGSTIQN